MKPYEKLIAYALALIVVAWTAALVWATSFVNRPAAPGKPGFPNDGTVTYWVPGGDL